MKPKLWNILGIAILLGLSTVAFAQQQNTKKIVRSGKTVYDFDEVDIVGRLKKPEGQSVMEAPEFRFRRLLDLDESFTPNIIRSVDEF
jgi:hypothetical protein